MPKLKMYFSTVYSVSIKLLFYIYKKDQEFCCGTSTTPPLLHPPPKKKQSPKIIKAKNPQNMRQFFTIIEDGKLPTKCLK